MAAFKEAQEMEPRAAIAKLCPESPIEHLEQQFKKAIADYEHYMATVGSWESKKTIEERLAAWPEELELEKQAKIAKHWLGFYK